MTWRELSAEQLTALNNPLVIDVRSPGEHKAENIPGSINVPLLSDEQRAVVGTIYKNEGEAAARRCALTLIAPRIPAIVDDILARRRPGQPIVVHCWRGGLRSEAVAGFLSVVGVDCWRLSGGYKAWRNMVLADLKVAPYEFIPIVLDGLTGTGKTELLRGLAALGHSVLDLESLANHRGSVFGGMGLGEQPTQKNFEAALWYKLRGFGREPVFMEAESRKIGKLSLPDPVMEMIATGHKILVTSSLEARVQRILSDYTSVLDDVFWSTASHLLGTIKERLGKKRTEEIEQIARSGQLKEAVKILLVEYYDPLYQRQIECNAPYALEVCGDDIALAANSISAWCARTHQAHLL